MRIETFLKQSLLFEVMRVSRSFDRHIERIFRAEVNLLEALVLAGMFFEHPQSVRPSRLAETLGTTRSNISHCISTLEAQGLIQRSVDPEDARSFCLLLRPSGKKYAMQVIRTLDRMQKDFELCLGTAKMNGVLDAMKRAEQVCADLAVLQARNLASIGRL